ncbi:MAG: S8 family serine peptidase, partial [Phycisphaerales bacterium]
MSSSLRADCPADLDSNGLVDGSDLGILLLNWGNAGVGDLDGSGMVAGGDVGIMLIAWGACPPSLPVLSLTLGTSEAVILEGGSVGFATIVGIVGVGDDPVDVGFTLSPSSKALSITTDLPSEGFTFDADGTAVFNTLLSSASLGEFSIEVTATPTVGDPVIATVPVRVVPVTGVPVLSPLSAAPGAVNPKSSTEVVVTVGVSGTTAPPASFRLLETDAKGGVVGEVATMLDDGVAPDVVAGDGVYTSTIVVSPEPGEERRFYKACEGSIACGEGLESGSLSIEMSIFPVGTVAGDPEAVVTLSDGTEIYGNQVLMIFVEGTTDARVAEVVDSIGGTVIGSIPASNAYQVGIPGDQTGEAVYWVIAQMKTVVDVDIVEPVFPSLAAEFVPNDPLWESQTSLLAIRATEAWTVATGSVAIAIVDTGVDSSHPDLAGKVVILPGSDVLDGDSDPSDPIGHGTRMAGIAAAIGNNAVGIAGVSWQSPVIAVRAFGAGGSDVSLASGIVFAASNGARVISVSGGLRESSAVLANAVAFAQERGCLVVAAAGNQSKQEGSVQTYPCSLPGVMCVGALDRDGDPLEGTNVGPWVSLAAPGDSVPTLEVGGGYGTAIGTSPAAAIVAGSAALVWSTDPSLDAETVRERLLGGCEAIVGSESLVGSGQVDVFESTFNGSFELPAIGTWTTQGTVSFIESLGPLVPTDGTRMAYLSTGPAAAQQAASLRAEFMVQPGVSEFAISFDYDFISEEWPEWVGSSFDDEMRIVVEEPDGSELLLAVE